MLETIQRSIQIRGQILDHVCWIEDIISEIISIYFCRNKDKTELFQYEILKYLSLEKKIKLIHSIVNSIQSNLKNNSIFKNKLNSIRIFRNSLAHNPLDILHQNDKVGYPIKYT